MTGLVLGACSGAGSEISTTVATAPPATTTTAPPPSPPTVTTTAPETTTTTLPPTPRREITADDRLEGVGDATGFGDPYDPGLGNGGFDVGHYVLDLSFDPADDVLAGVVTIEAKAVDILESFNLDFTGFDITGLFVDDEPAEYTRRGRELTVSPTTPIADGADFTVAVEYSGTPQPTESAAIQLTLGWLTDPDGDRYVLAEPDAAHTWFPCNDHPLDKATYEFRLTVPDPLLAAANGELIDTITDVGATTWVWEMDDPMATYLATVVIGDYEIVPDEAGTAAAGFPVRNVLPAELASNPPRSLRAQGEMLALFADLFGPYPFDEYGITIVDGVPGALETQTLAVFGSEVLDAGDVPISPNRTIPLFEVVLVHEIAHHWFGNSVSPAAWQDIWLNEGFASYSEFLWIEHLVGRDAMEAGIEQERAVWAAAPDGADPPATPAPDALFSGSVYRIGAMTLHALRLTVGDEAFFTTLRTFHDRFAGGTASTADFIAVAEETAGTSLDDLFQAWLYERQVPAFPNG